MKTLSQLTLLFTVLAVSVASETVQAQQRDAGAKARGDYSFLSGATSPPATQQRTMRAPVASVVPQSVPTAQSRSYSYNTKQAEPTCAATPSEMPADMPSMSKLPATGGRTYSYAPSAPIRTRSAAGIPFGYSGGVRNAASKALGQY
jgi:hypothetical protein